MSPASRGWPRHRRKTGEAAPRLETACALDEPQAEKAAIEVDIGLDFPGDRRDVVQAVVMLVSLFYPPL